METITLTVDPDDARAIHAAISVRQQVRVLPDGEGNLAGRIIAEICRGWLDRQGLWESAEDE